MYLKQHYRFFNNPLERSGIYVCTKYKSRNRITAPVILGIAKFGLTNKLFTKRKKRFFGTPENADFQFAICCLCNILIVCLNYRDIIFCYPAIIIH